MLRVAFVHDFHSAATPSGENEVVEAETAALSRAGVEVEVISLHNDEMARRPLHTLQGSVTVATGIGRSPLRAIQRFGADVIHVHSLFPYFGTRWLRRAPAPVVATLHSYRPLCATGYLFRDGEVCTRCADGHPWSGVRYGCYRGSRLATLPLALSARNGPAQDPLLQQADVLLHLSERARIVLTAAGVSPAKLRLDWHFVPDALTPAVGATRDDAWLFVGRLVQEKGIDRLVAEWPASEPLRVVGDGPLRGAVESAAQGKKIEVLGRLSRPEVMDELQRAFGLVFPSVWFETFGLGYIEALAAGTPTLAFRPNVVADAVERDGTGVVASWADVAGALADGRRSFDGLRARCRSLFEERYTEAAFVARRTALYQGLVNERQARAGCADLA